MYDNMYTPPITEYEQVVRPVAVAARGMALHEKDSGGFSFDQRRRKRHKEDKKQEEDVPFEPFVGKLFDYTA